MREMRGGLKGFRVFFACLLLGVASIAGVGSLTKAINLGLSEEGRALMTGDMEIRYSRVDATEDHINHFEASGIVSRKIKLRAMTKADKSTRRRLTELKAVDNLYPLYGELITDPPLARDQLFNKQGELWGASIPANLADVLRAEVGDILSIGDLKFEIRTILVTEPDLANEGFQLGPSVMISYDAMLRSGLIREGSLVEYYYRLKMPADTDLAQWREDIYDAYPDERFRVREYKYAASGFRRFVDRLSMFLTLVGLSALVVGGVGVGNAVRNYLEARVETIATFKVLGSTSGMIFKIYMTQVMLLAFFAIAIGLAIGAYLPLILGDLLQGQLPVPPKFGIYPVPLFLAAVYGLLITIAFSLWPLGKAQDVPAARLYRDLVSPDVAWPRKRYIALIALSAVTISVMAVVFSDRPMMAAGFVAGALAVLLLLRGTGAAIQKLAAKLPRPKKPTLRLALANIYRPGAATGSVVMSLGLGLTLFATITLVEGNLQDRVNEEVPEIAPAFFFMDIQKHEGEQFSSDVNSFGGVEDLRMVANLRARMVSVKGVPANDVKTNGFGWVVRGDRTVSYSDTLPPQNELVEGEWWPADYSGPPLVSFGAREAEGIGITVGDHVEVSIMGRTFKVEVANLRKFEWGQMNFNFVMIFDSNMLKDAPHSYMASLKVQDDVEAAVHRKLTDDYPGVTTIRVKELIESVNDILSQIKTSVQATALVAILAGILVLAGAIAAGHRHRVYDAVILKVVGAVRLDVLKAYMIEYFALGIIVGLVALGLGSLAGYVVVTMVMDMAYSPQWPAMISTIVASIVITVGFGLMGTWKTLGAKPMAVLRNE
jgi:putative ABC transport system permease protein